MSRTMLKNFCVEPKQKDCNCTQDIRCGGIITLALDCPEHGVNGALDPIAKTHFHPIQGRSVGTQNSVRYDHAKAS